MHRLGWESPSPLPADAICHVQESLNPGRARAGIRDFFARFPLLPFGSCVGPCVNSELDGVSSVGPVVEPSDGSPVEPLVWGDDVGPPPSPGGAEVSSEPPSHAATTLSSAAAASDRPSRVRLVIVTPR